MAQFVDAPVWRVDRALTSKPHISRIFRSFAAMKTLRLADGRRIACYPGGEHTGDDLPLVLLHGFCEDSSVWDAVLPLLGDVPTWRMDLPGFGTSDLPPAPGMEVYAASVQEALEALGIGRCVLAGHSMGGYTALAFAKKYPDRLAGLSLVHSHPYSDGPERIEGRRRGIETVQAGKKDLYVAQLIPGLFAPLFASAHPETVDALVQRGRQQPGEGIVAALEGMIARVEQLDTLRDCRFPVQFILGDLDAIIPLEDALAAATQPTVADIRVLPGVGHLAMLEQPQQTASMLRDFWLFCLQRQGVAHANEKQTTLQ